MSEEIYDIALALATARLDEEMGREGHPPSARFLIAMGVGEGVRAACKQLIPEIGDAREELSRLKCEIAQRQALDDSQAHYSGAGLKGIRGSHRDIDLVRHWQSEAIRAVYITERYKLWLNEAQRLALLVRSLGGDPEPPKTKEATE